MDPLPGEMKELPDDPMSCGFCLLIRNADTGRRVFYSDPECPEHGEEYGSGSWHEGE